MNIKSTDKEVWDLQPAGCGEGVMGSEQDWGVDYTSLDWDV